MPGPVATIAAAHRCRRCRSEGLANDLLIVPSSRPKGKQPRQTEEPQERQLSKNERRKLQQIAKKKAMRENLSQVGGDALQPGCAAAGLLPCWQ